MTTDDLLDLDSVIPVVVLDDPQDAVPLGRALLAGGLRTIELTLRTPAALPAIELLAGELPELFVGAGTIATSAQAEQARAAGASFLVSPGHTPRLLDAMQESGMPFLAGCATPSDVLGLLERGITSAKLFPAAVAGGISLARALAGPFPQMRFCPTGGIDARTATDWLALDNVACVGGTWIARNPRDVGTVTALAREAAALRREPAPLREAPEPGSR
jgi:2-dehydro-3-deoxyphosphogluconate aldolase/(4S)-4-hydroxy-2-oxoglutarate aldolase